ncbi:hypothetical protein BUALT_Bualt14G0101400 [Buddleja alternifolia]|uniref:Uncharacterized protein n=1 Tax=Buddleja alternifolia TaxID=168488 RepID=A0AAV6WIA8_9LAMI|nr:hypothetical protein BUALT_Bualt14G0101400 [Buddleja alternifolia]
MTTQFNAIHSRAVARAAVSPFHCGGAKSPLFLFSKENQLLRYTNSSVSISRINVSNGGGDSYLDMWKKAVDRERRSIEFERMAENASENEEVNVESGEELEKKSSEFEKLLEVSVEERDRIQRMQVIDRAAAAIAAARALLKENSPSQGEVSGEVRDVDGGEEVEDQKEGLQNSNSPPVQSVSSGIGTPGPSFWTWAPPPTDDDMFTEIKPAGQASPSPAQSNPILEKERSLDILSIPFETSMLQSGPSLPPLQSNMEVEKIKVTQETPHLGEEQELGVQFSAHAAEAADALGKVSEALSKGMNRDGSRWWKETGIEKRPDGVVCKWTLTRGVSADKAIEWENKYWEAADEFGYKELGSEKSGRDAVGNVWREYWRESMMQNEGVVHFEKTADKWGKNMQGGEWQEKWWEHYDTSGRAEKWADKWCSIDPNTPLEAGHAHVWHERNSSKDEYSVFPLNGLFSIAAGGPNSAVFGGNQVFVAAAPSLFRRWNTCRRLFRSRWGEDYDGQGGSTKYTDKWAERFEGDGWAKWGDKWDEHFDLNSHGVKQGESWWEGKYGDRWNRTWGEGHNGSGWVHKYGKSSSGEHWDTHVQQDTWYERYPHYGFFHCFENSVQLREVEKPSEWDRK